MRPKFIALTAAAVLLSAQASTGQPERSIPAPRNYMCSLTSAASAQDGEWRVEDGYDDERRPSPTDLPKSDKSDLRAEMVSPDGRYYSYVKQSGDGIRSYQIHGVFDFHEKTLTTSRSTLLPATDGGYIALATSFLFLCSEID